MYFGNISITNINDGYFKILISRSQLLIYKHTINFGILTLYFLTLVNSLDLVTFLVHFFGGGGGFYI